MKERSSKLMILDKKPLVTEAPEPTNIIWENRQNTFLSRFLKSVLVVIIITILLAISFVIVVELKKVARDARMKY